MCARSGGLALLASRDLLLQAAAACSREAVPRQAAQLLHGGLHSAVITLASAAASCCCSRGFSSLAAALASCSSSSSRVGSSSFFGGLQQQQHHQLQLLQQQQQQQRAYARAARPPASRAAGRQQREPGAAGEPQQRPPLPSQGAGLTPLGRLRRLCVPTQQLRQPVVLSSVDPFAVRDPLAIDPVQVDGSRRDGLEDSMLLRQQLEGSALPNDFKRSHLISPCWDEVLLDVNRTIKVTKGGKVETLHALVVVGNHDGLLGVGQHSGKNIQKVTLDALLKAYKNLVPIPRYRGHTVFHPIDVKQRKVRLQAWPRQLGFGITASPLVTELCDLAGLHNLTVKLSGNRRNVRNVVQVFVDALSHQSLPHDGVEGSGVYVREVYPRSTLPCGLRRGVDVP